MLRCVAVGACRNKRRNAQLVPSQSCQHERCTANLRSRDRPGGRCVTRGRGRDGVAGQKRVAYLACIVLSIRVCYKLWDQEV